METNAQYEKVIRAIAEQESDLLQLCLQLGNTPSFHAQERKLGEAVLQWLGAAGIAGELQFITGESVTATTPDNTTATASVMANSRNSEPVKPP